MNELLVELSSELAQKGKETFLEGIIAAFLGDPLSFGKSIKELMKTAKSIPDMILWNNLYLFLSEGNFDYDCLGKLAQRLDESGNKKENATNIIYVINRVDDPRKAKFISWLTLSVIHKYIDFDSYFRLVKTVENLVYADLCFLGENVEFARIDSDDSHVDDFLANGLIYNVDGGFAFSKKSYELVKFGIRKFDNIKIPENMIERQILSMASDEDLNFDELFKNE